MPLSFATILGEMVTLIGTPPNIVIAALREDALGEAYGMFDFAPVGLVVASAGVAFVALVGRRLLPGRLARCESVDVVRDLEASITELLVPETSSAAGRRVRELYAVAVGASCALLTPIGHENNTIVMGPGGYRFGDHWQIGLPLELLVLGISVPVILQVWPLLPAPARDRQDQPWRQEGFRREQGGLKRLWRAHWKSVTSASWSRARRWMCWRRSGPGGR